MKKYFIFYVLYLFCSTQVNAQNWSLTGNNGTTAANFLGTKDNKALSIRTNNIERMRIQPGGNIGIGINAPLQRLDVNGNINIRKNFFLYMDNHKVLRIDSASGNTFLGVGVGDKNISSLNTGIGYQSLFSNTSGGYNTAVGYQAMYSNTAGFYNTATGLLSLYSNTTGSYNSAYGNYAMMLNTTGYSNTAGGYAALFSNKTGSNNAAQGYAALYYNTTGAENVATGREALYSNSIGNYNTALGSLALYSNTASYNTATGFHALYFNTTGSDNTATGASALYNTNTGFANTAFGAGALYTNTTGKYNTAAGDYALYNTSVSWGNTAFGDIAGASFNNGYYNTFIGAETDATAADIYNSTALGRGARVSAPSQVRIGNSFVTSIGGYAGWSTISDGRLKKNIKDNVPGLAFINKLKAVTYNLDLAAADKFLQVPGIKQDNARQREFSRSDMAARESKQKVVYTGFVAQEVEKAAKELGYDFSGVDAAKTDKELYSLRYSEFVVPLVKAAQELSEKVEKLEAALEQKNSGDVSSLASKASVIAGAGLSQNSPNPFNNITTVSYTLPQQYKSAKIIVTNKSGIILKQVYVTGNGKKSFTFDASALSAGAYQYALYVDGRLIGSKQMIVIR